MVSSIEESEKFDCGSSGTGMLLSSSSVCDWKYWLKILASSFGSFMGCPFLISGGISSILSLPKRVLIVFHQSLLENFPDVIFSESLILYSFFASLKAEILLFLSFRNFSQLFGVFTFLACLWARFRFLMIFLISLLIQGGSKGLTVIVLFGMVHLQNSKIFEVTFSA